VATIRYWAAAKAAAGLAEEVFEAHTLADLVEASMAAHPQSRFADVIRRCSWVVDGDPIGGRPHRDVHLGRDSVVEALPPFAGGQ